MLFKYYIFFKGNNFIGQKERMCKNNKMWVWKSDLSINLKYFYNSTKINALKRF